jgi:hypothetical protein
MVVSFSKWEGSSVSFSSSYGSFILLYWMGVESIIFSIGEMKIIRLFIFITIAQKNYKNFCRLYSGAMSSTVSSNFILVADILQYILWMCSICYMLYIEKKNYIFYNFLILIIWYDIMQRIGVKCKKWNGRCIWECTSSL